MFLKAYWRSCSDTSRLRSHLNNVSTASTQPFCHNTRSLQPCVWLPISVLKTRTSYVPAGEAACGSTPCRWTPWPVNPLAGEAPCRSIRLPVNPQAGQPPTYLLLSADSEFTVALLHHQQRAVSSGEGAGCEHRGFTHTHTFKLQSSYACLRADLNLLWLTLVVP